MLLTKKKITKRTEDYRTGFRDGVYMREDGINPVRAMMTTSAKHACAQYWTGLKQGREPRTGR